MPGRNSLGPRGFLTEEEKQNKPKVTKELLVRIFRYLLPYWKHLLAVFAIIIISSVVGLLPSIITGRIIDEAIGGKNFSLLIQLVILSIVTLTASNVIRVFESEINSWVSKKIVADMKNEMFTHLQSMPHSFFTSEKQGDIITRMNSDVSGVSSAISSTLTNVVSNICTIVTTIVALLRMDAKLALVGVLVIPLLVLPTKSAGKNRYEMLTLSQQKTDQLNDLTSEALSVSGSLLIKLFSREESKNREFAKLNDEAMALSVKEARAGKWFGVIMGIFTNLGPLLIYLAGGYLIIKMNDSTLTVGAITSTVTMINRLYRPVESLLNISVDFTRSLALFTRIFDYLDRVPAIQNREVTVDVDFKERTDIEYQNVEFCYSPDVPLIKDLSFTVPSGKMYAIVGPSGSGKSTVVNLLPRLYDVVGGAVKINGVDVRDIDIHKLRDNIGVVTQEAYMFNGTIRDNLLFAKADATDEEIYNACRIANINDFIISQPEGYNTEVGNRGLKLSGGEKQRISLARVILKDPAILILDEATSALDSISENAIQNALETMMVGRTSIVIAHRLSTILKADRIMVVADGIIKEQGTHEELLALNGVYKQLYETQFRKAIEYENSSKNEIDIAALSTQYSSERISEEDIADVYNLCKDNRKYYEYAKTEPSKQDLTEVISQMPDNTGPENKYFIGFYDGKHNLVAILDLITRYPNDRAAFIGWFMVNASMQQKGIGSAIFADIRAALKAQGFEYLRLGCIKENSEAISFWKKQGFKMTGEEIQQPEYVVLPMERNI